MKTYIKRSLGKIIIGLYFGKMVLATMAIFHYNGIIAGSVCGLFHSTGKIFFSKSNFGNHFHVAAKMLGIRYP